MMIATMLGVVMLRTSTEVQQLTTASAAELAEPLEQVLRELLDGVAKQ